MKKTLPIYLISLKEDSERREKLKKSFQNNFENFILINATDGRIITAKKYYEKLLDYFLEYDKVISPSELGCTLSHIDALESFLKSGEERALIIEDDIIGSDKDISKINLLSQKIPNKSILICGGQSGLNRRYQIGKPYEDEIYNLSKFFFPFIYRTCSYVVTKESALRILESHKRSLNLADKWDYFFQGSDFLVLYTNTLSHPVDLSNSHIENDRNFFKKRKNPYSFFSKKLVSRVLRKIKNEFLYIYEKTRGNKQLP